MSWLGLTLAVLAVLLLAALLLRRVCPGLSKAAVVLLTVYALVMIVGTAICWDVQSSPTADADFAVVLGYALQDGEATEELADRLELALNWLNSTEETLLVVTGGDPGGQGVTEAVVMAQWLQSHGADMSRVCTEDRARDTKENFLLSLELVRELGVDGDTVLILTNEYHQTRAGFWARQVGLIPLHRSCATPPARHAEAAVREVYAFVKALSEAILR